MSAEKRVIFGQLGRLKPEKIEEYEALHAAPWPEVLQTLHACNLRNYSIFREGEQVFAYFEYVGEDYDADMEKMAQDEATQRWWTRTKPCFQTYAVRADSEFYADMKQIFYVARIIKMHRRPKNGPGAFSGMWEEQVD